MPSERSSSSGRRNRPPRALALDYTAHLGGGKIKTTAALRRRVVSRSASVAIIGQGYVGLSLACAAAEAGFPVIAIDVDRERIEDLRQGILSVPGVNQRLFQAGTSSGRIDFTTDRDRLKEGEVILICVPTPLRDHSPDLSFVEQACTDIAHGLAPGRLIILESTTYPGTTDQLVRPLLETSGLIAGKDFLLAYSPERIDPGNEEFNLQNTPKVVGGHTPEATGTVTLFYEQLVDKVVVVSSCRAAELSKLLENTFRHVNVALANEMAMLSQEMGIDVWEVVEAAATKPFGFMPFYPGPGVGGHCVPLDPTYLSWQVRREAGHQFRILEQAEDINAQMPAYVASRIGDALNDAGKAVRGAKIMVLGVAYKADLGDVRESPAIKVIKHLHKRGAKVSFHDPYIEAVSSNGTLFRRSELTQRRLSSSDCVAILTPHSAYDFEWVAVHSRLIFDARNAYSNDQGSKVVRL
jgi:UDP-N-acetyl-D-glucosamine dehydrogenase